MCLSLVFDIVITKDGRIVSWDEWGRESKRRGGVDGEVRE